MKLFLGVIWVLLFGACTTFNANENGLRRACKSGIAEYDDGSMNFRCKEDRNEDSSNTQRQHEDIGRTIK